MTRTLALPRNSLIAAASGGLMAAGSAVAFNVPLPIAAALGALAALVALGPMRAPRIAAVILAAMAGLLLAIFAVLLNAPNLILALVAVTTGLASWYMAWRDATSSGATRLDRSVAAAFTALALLVLVRALTQVGGEGGQCWLPGLPVDCLQ